MNSRFEERPPNLLIASFINNIAESTPVALPDFVIIDGLLLGKHAITLEADDGANLTVSDEIPLT